MSSRLADDRERRSGLLGAAPPPEASNGEPDARSLGGRGVGAVMRRLLTSLSVLGLLGAFCSGCADDETLERAEECRKHDGDNTCGGAPRCRSIWSSSAIYCGLACDGSSSDPGCPPGYTCVEGNTTGEDLDIFGICIDDESLPL